MSTEWSLYSNAYALKILLENDETQPAIIIVVKPDKIVDASPPPIT